MSLRTRLVVVAFAVLLGAAPCAFAKDGGGDARVTGACSRGASSQLRLQARDGMIRVEFEIRRHRPGEAWRVALVHERRVEWRGTLHTSGSGGALRLRRSVRDLDGPDQVTARASGPRGLTCVASATLT